MSDFPGLTQYPAASSRTYGVRVLRFLDGAEQRFPEARVKRRWKLNYALLDEEECREFEAFFEASGGRAREFAFAEPWDETTHENCRLEADSMAVTWSGEGRGAVTVTVEEDSR